MTFIPAPFPPVPSHSPNPILRRIKKEENATQNHLNLLALLLGGIHETTFLAWLTCTHEYGLVNG